MRKVALFCAALLAAALGVTAVAFAIQGSQSVDVSLRSNQAGTSSSPRSVGIMTVTLGTSIVRGERPWAATHAVVHFDRNLVFDSRKFPVCSLSQIRSNDSRCPAGSKIGSGGAQAAVFSGRTRTANVRPVVTAYNGSKSTHPKIYLLVVESRFNVRDVMIGSVRGDSGRYGSKLDVVIPTTLQNGGLPNLKISITRFRTSVGGSRGGKAYVALKGCGGRLRFKGDVSFTDGSTKSGTSTAACRR